MKENNPNDISSMKYGNGWCWNRTKDTTFKIRVTEDNNDTIKKGDIIECMSKTESPAGFFSLYWLTDEEIKKYNMQAIPVRYAEEIK